MTAKKPRMKRSPPPRHTHVLILAPEGGRLVHRKGSVDVQPGQIQGLKARGMVRLVDLTGLTETTYVALPGFAPEDILPALTLSPGEYLPNTLQEDVLLDARPTVNDQGETAALIAYAPQRVLADLFTELRQAGLTPVGAEPAVLTALHAADTRGTVVLHSQPHQHVGLLVVNGQVIGRTRVPATEAPEERVDQLYQMVGGMASLLGSVQSAVEHVVLLGDPETTEQMRAQVEQNNPDVQVTVLRGEDLARFALTHAPPVTLSPLLPRRQAEGRPPLWPLAAALAAGLLPFGVITVQSAGILRQMQAEQRVLDQNRVPLREYADLQDREQAATRTVQEAQTILGTRVNWREHLTRVTDQLPEQGGRYTVRLGTLDAAATLPTPAPPLDGQPAPLPTLTPSVTYTFSAYAASRTAATNVITNFEQTFHLNLEQLSKAPDGQWLLRASMQEKP